jgi:hypothetical protein
MSYYLKVLNDLTIYILFNLKYKNKLSLFHLKWKKEMKMVLINMGQQRL